MFVDYSGKTVPIVDRSTGEIPNVLADAGKQPISAATGLPVTSELGGGDCKGWCDDRQCGGMVVRLESQGLQHALSEQLDKRMRS